MQLFIDGTLTPLPSWAKTMIELGVEAERPPGFPRDQHPGYVVAQVGDFAVGLAGELKRRGQWIVEIQPETDRPLIRTAVVNCTTKLIADVAPKLRTPTVNALAASVADHREAAQSLRDGYPKLAVELLERVQAAWGDVCDSLDALAAMGSLPATIRPESVERLMGAIEATFPHEKDAAAKAIDELGDLAEQWARELGGKRPDVN